MSPRLPTLAAAMTATVECQAWIGLGGNLGDVRRTLNEARAALALSSTRPLVASALYGSAPWGERPESGGPFLNQVVGLWTRATPEALLATLLALEATHGRERSVRWGPRTLDLDLLAFGSATRSTSALTAPHPRLAERRFVLMPWAQVAPDFPVPPTGATVASLLAACPDPGAVWPLSD